MPATNTRDSNNLRVGCSSCFILEFASDCPYSLAFSNRQNFPTQGITNTSRRGVRLASATASPTHQLNEALRYSDGLITWSATDTPTPANATIHAADKATKRKRNMSRSERSCQSILYTLRKASAAAQ